MYHPLSGQEQALLIRDGLVTQQLNPERLKRGVVIPDHADLVVARGGIPLPAQPGDRVRIFSGSRNGLGRHHNVLGGGPLLVANGRIVLNGQAEGFSSDFLALKAPRTVVGQGRDGTWLITLRGINGSHPTLLETALVMRQLGLKHALNLDGGSSTTVVAGGHTVMNGRGRNPSGSQRARACPSLHTCNHGQRQRGAPWPPTSASPQQPLPNWDVRPPWPEHRGKCTWTCCPASALSM